MFDNRLKKLRMAKNLTQEEVAKALGLPKTTYCNYERDERISTHTLTWSVTVQH